MTTKLQRGVRCSVCGTESFMLVLVSSTSFGAPDLDTRPAPLIRFENDMFVECCPECRYCAEDLEAPPPRGVHKLLERPEYLELAGAEGPPAAYRQFLAAAYLAEAAGDRVGATWHAIRAAWSCDDKGARDAAVACRVRAVELGLAAIAAGQDLVPDRGSRLIIADLLRRTGQFEAALEECRRALTELHDEELHRFVDFEMRLAAGRDVEAHSIEEAGHSPAGRPEAEAAAAPR